MGPWCHRGVACASAATLRPCLQRPTLEWLLPFMVAFGRCPCGFRVVALLCKRMGDLLARVHFTHSLLRFRRVVYVLRITCVLQDVSVAVYVCVCVDCGVRLCLWWWWGEVSGHGSS